MADAVIIPVLFAMSPLPHFVTYHDQNDYANLLPPDVSYIKVTCGIITIFLTLIISRDSMSSMAYYRAC